MFNRLTTHTIEGTHAVYIVPFCGLSLKNQLFALEKTKRFKILIESLNEKVLHIQLVCVKTIRKKFVCQFQIFDIYYIDILYRYITE